MDQIADEAASEVSKKNLRPDRKARKNERPFAFADDAARLNEHTDKVADGLDGMDGGPTGNAGKDN